MYYSFDWLVNRINAYGWNLVSLVGIKRSYLGKGLPLVPVVVREVRIGGRMKLIIHERYVNVFDEIVQELFGETIYDGQEEWVEFEEEA